jgi:hypothetical protein
MPEANLSLEDTLKEVWRQTLVEGLPEVTLDGKAYPVNLIKSKGLRQVYFKFGDQTLAGIEQNPKTASRWAALARSGKKVMQFRQESGYLAVVADGKCNLYGSRASKK